MHVNGGAASHDPFLQAVDEWAAFDRDWARLAGGSFLHHYQPGASAHLQVLGPGSGRTHSSSGGLFQDVGVRGRQAMPNL